MNKEQGTGKLMLANNGVTDWRIVLGEQASESERFAAEELKRFLTRISDAHYEIIEDSAPRRDYEIWVGWNNRAPADDSDAEGLGDEGFMIRTYPASLLIAGGRKRGTLYGVYAFLETYLGCRWFSPDAERIPRRRTVEIGPIAERQVPAMEYREPFFFESWNAEWAARNRCNGHRHGLTERHGGCVNYVQPFVHTFDALVPVERYFQEHPEYFSEIDGVRRKDHTQLCLSNPDVLTLSLERIREWLKTQPDASIVSVSQNDWENPCECPECRRIDETEGSPSGSLIRFVNRIAEALESDYPHVAIDTLAYQYTRKPPRNLRPRPNVIVRLCSIECCFAHPLDACQVKMLKTSADSAFVEDLQAWGRICNRLYVWDYVANFAYYVSPFPNLGVLGPNLRLFARNNVKGVFEQGSYAEGGGGEFAELRMYVLSKLLWNPQADERFLIDEFLAGYYGQGGLYLRKYIDALAERVHRDGLHASIYDRPDAEYLTADILALAEECFDLAERAAEDDQFVRRLRIARLPIRVAKLAQQPPGLPGREEEIDRLDRDIRAFGLTQLTEHVPAARTLKRLREGVLFTHNARYEGGWSPFEEI
ncbi:DUF4838 domain-containing protein [Cohnella caldifontis]|uniref:DUF4838 domain-containing protein n=1 Tax=Cohnella caldifontis TaxID=3027471 RepID=UPI0023ECB2F0|nr:DUF4838 domain-containing protein [Cohnella sp. YIM B05605]